MNFRRLKLWHVLTAIVVALVFGFFIGGLLVQYSVEFWTSLLTHEEVDAPYRACCIAGIFIGWNIAIPVAAITGIVDIVL